MAGFGPEDNHFVVELTYNYGIKKYKLGNDFQVVYSVILVDYFVVNGYLIDLMNFLCNRF